MKTAKKTAKRLTAILLALMTIVSCLSLMASAKNVCKEISGKANYSGGNRTVFKVVAENTKKHTIKMSMTKGTLGTPEHLGGHLSTSSQKTYGYYEITIYGIKSNGQEKELTRYNIKNEGSASISLSGYTTYKIKVYNWKTSTIASYRGGFSHWLTGEDYSSYAEWTSIPTWKISKTSGVSYCY